MTYQFKTEEIHAVERVIALHKLNGLDTFAGRLKRAINKLSTPYRLPTVSYHPVHIIWAPLRFFKSVTIEDLLKIETATALLIITNSRKVSALLDASSTCFTQITPTFCTTSVLFIAGYGCFPPLYISHVKIPTIHKIELAV